MFFILVLSAVVLLLFFNKYRLQNKLVAEREKRNVLEKKQLRLKALFVPYYFCVMHYAVYRGFFRFVKGNQSVLWERAKRA